MRTSLEEIYKMKRKQPLRDKLLGASVSTEFHAEVLAFCQDRDWILSRFIEEAIAKEMDNIIDLEREDA